MLEKVAGIYSKSWPGRSTYYDNLMAIIQPYITDYNRLPCLLARLEVIVKRNGSFEIDRAEYEQVHSAVWEIDSEEEETPEPEAAVPVPEAAPEPEAGAAVPEAAPAPEAAAKPGAKEPEVLMDDGDAKKQSVVTEDGSEVYSDSSTNSSNDYSSDTEDFGGHKLLPPNGAPSVEDPYARTYLTHPSQRRIRKR